MNGKSMGNFPHWINHWQIEKSDGTSLGLSTDGRNGTSSYRRKSDVNGFTNCRGFSQSWFKKPPFLVMNVSVSNRSFARLQPPGPLLLKSTFFRVAWRWSNDHFALVRWPPWLTHFLRQVSKVSPWLSVLKTPSLKNHSEERCITHSPQNSSANSNWCVPATIKQLTFVPIVLFDYRLNPIAPLIVFKMELDTCCSEEFSALFVCPITQAGL